MAHELQLIKHSSGILIPATPETSDLLQSKIKLGSVLVAEFRQVRKGNCIRHDGEVYRENSLIPVSGKDAERLLAAGVIADVHALRQRALSAARGVKITTE